MNVESRIHRWADRIAHAPVVRTFEQRAARRRFLENTDENLFFGVYESMEAAQDDAPHSRPLGYDNDGSANLPYTSVVGPRDYPALFWLLRSIDEGLRSVFDLGGHVGVKYYAYRRFLDLPDDVRWTVCDVPAVVARGRELALARDPGRRLAFTDRYDEASDHDVLLASGSLQYLPLTLAEMLEPLDPRPRRLVINGTPIHASRAFFTLNSIGTAFCPYRVQRRETFVDALAALGYVKRAEWENTGKSMSIPDHAGYDVPNYSGFCFDLRPSNGP